MVNATVQVARRHWWLLLLRGILAILFGIIALAAPGIALLAFSYVFDASISRIPFVGDPAL